MKIVLLTFLFQTDCTSLLDIPTYKLQRIEPKERFLLILWFFSKFFKMWLWFNPVRTDRTKNKIRAKISDDCTDSDRLSYLVRSAHPCWGSQNISCLENRVQVFQMFVEWNRLCWDKASISFRWFWWFWTETRETGNLVTMGKARTNLSFGLHLWSRCLLKYWSSISDKTKNWSKTKSNSWTSIWYWKCFSCYRYDS